MLEAILNEQNLRQILKAGFLAVGAMAAAGIFAFAQQASGPAPAPYEVEVISMFPHGFEPAEISRPQGPFLLVIRNYDHEGDHAFDVASGDVQILPPLIEKDRFRWIRLVNLQPGDHLLQDHQRAERHLKITIRP
jgi:hypothetical protein